MWDTPVWGSTACTVTWRLGRLFTNTVVTSTMVTTGGEPSVLSQPSALPSSSWSRRSSKPGQTSRSSVTVSPSSSKSHESGIPSRPLSGPGHEVVGVVSSVVVDDVGVEDGVVEDVVEPEDEGMDAVPPEVVKGSGGGGGGGGGGHRGRGEGA